MISGKKQFELTCFRVKLISQPNATANAWYRQMVRPCCCVLIVLLLNGCASINGGRWSAGSSELLERAREVVSESSGESAGDAYEQEKQVLFDQPYIDPLTDYLIEHRRDPERASVLKQVEQERDLRCAAVARRYAGEPPSAAVLEQFDAGYAYSCPLQVSAFEDRLSRRKVGAEPMTEPDPVAARPATSRTVSEQALSDCYLLTRIRNYSAARKACLEPAENGDLRSQVNMATIAHAFEDYTSARMWAKKAAPGSSEAAFLLGRIYAGGLGVNQNRKQAVYWFSEAAGRGHKPAQEALEGYPLD